MSIESGKKVSFSWLNITTHGDPIAFHEIPKLTKEMKKNECEFTSGLRHPADDSTEHLQSNVQAFTHNIASASIPASTLDAAVHKAISEEGGVVSRQRRADIKNNLRDMLLPDMPWTYSSVDVVMTKTRLYIMTTSMSRVDRIVIQLQLRGYRFAPPEFMTPKGMPVKYAKGHPEPDMLPEQYLQYGRYMAEGGSETFIPVTPAIIHVGQTVMTVSAADTDLRQCPECRDAFDRGGLVKKANFIYGRADDDSVMTLGIDFFNMCISGMKIDSEAEGIIQRLNTMDSVVILIEKSMKQWHSARSKNGFQDIVDGWK